MAEILCIGDSCADIIIPFKGEPVIRCGGSSANTACALGKLNVSVSFAGKAGEDPAGFQMKEEMERSGVDTSHFLLDPDDSSTQIQITIDEDGERHPVLLNAEDPSYLKISPEELDEIDLSETRYILTNGMMLFRNPAASSILSFLKKAHERDIRIFLDVNLRPETVGEDRSILNEVIALSDYVSASLQDDLLPLTETETLTEAMDRLDKTNKIIIVHDPNGAYIFNEDEVIKADSYPVTVADSIGAGDNFNAGFLYGLIKARSLEDCGRIACALAAYSLRYEGARNTPDEAALFRCMNEIPT